MTTSPSAALEGRRQFLKSIAATTGAVVLVPAVTACGGATAQPDGQALSEIPLTRPEGWDPIAYNKARGNAGAIPTTYLPSINGPDGDANHLGKHLPFVPADVDAPEGFLAIMWGDPDKGHARHPNAVRSEANDFEGHWYNWIRVRPASASGEELESSYPEWPASEGEDGGYAVYGGGALTDDGGKNTIYLAAIPAGVSSGDWVRIYAHCLTHGEYVDFIRVP